MKYFLGISSFIFLSTALNAQSYWAQGTGGNDVDETMDICSDNSGNIVSAGYFTNSVAFGTSTTLTSASIGIPDISVSKSNSSGVIQWAVRAGGFGSDRALSVKTDASGNIYITGFYYGTASFGSLTLTSSNGSQDIFIAKLNSSGTFIWAVSAGGNMADIGNAIDVDVNGNVFVTGQFQGTAAFGSSTLISMINPVLSAPSIDIFTAKYDNNGNFLWVRQGKAEFTDRGLDVVADASGNIFVCGQFSDTILFNQVHNNPVMNAIFLIKYDANGNEIWFRRASGTFSIAYSLVINSSQDIYMTGDYQGTLAFYGPPNNYLNDTYSKRVFVAKYTNSGMFIWAQSESSDNYISSRSISLDPNGDPYIAGEYGCTLNEYADVFGQGTFNSIGYQDIFTVKYNASSGFRQWMRNFGGPGNDKAHSILITTINNPVIAGSYEKKMLWATDWVTLTNNNPWNPGSWSGNSAYCSDPSYGNYSVMACKGFSDGFIAQAVDITRQPYDYYHRTGSACLRDFVGGCVDSTSYTSYCAPFSFSCQDTLTFCGVGYLYSNTHTGSGLSCSIGPDYHFQWSSSPSDTLYYDIINTTNYYSVIMTTVDGCYTSQDTVYAIVNPLPLPPTITDDHGVNNQHPQCADPILSCKPDTVLLIGGNINGNSLSWYQGSSCYQNNAGSNCYLGGAFITSNDSLYVSSSGYYNVVLTNQYGCKNSNCVPVLLDSLLPPLVPISQIPDTIVACYGDLVVLNVIDTITGTSGPFYSFAGGWTSNPALAINYYPGNNYLNGAFIALNSGTYIVNENIIYINQCDTQYYSVQDTFYLLVNPTPVVTVSINGPNYVCQGDTIILHIITTASTTVNTVVTTNPVIDSIIVTGAGFFTASAIITDTTTGCGSTANDWHQVQDYPNPVLTTIPFSGLICPNDSVLINCNTVGTNYVWIGPNGILPYNTQSIYDDVPGFYHCLVTNSAGCVLTSNTIEIKQYNTPYLLPTPSYIVCMGQSVTLQVITNDTTLIQWNPPLSGSSTTQVVNQTGVYSCYVTMCGITTLCSLTVIVSQAVAQITGPAVICPGDSALLIANTGMIGYQWSPNASFNDSAYVQAGVYSLTTTDVNGCTASASFTVSLDTSVSKPSANDTSVCAGTTATLYATGTGQIEWYSSLTSTFPIYSGNPFTTPPINSQTTYYIATSNSAGCHSLRDSVTVFITAASLPPNISITDSVCNGDTIFLSTMYQPNTTYSWTGPNGFVSSLQNPVITNATSLNSGTYTLVVSGNGCTSSPVTDTVVVLSAIIPITAGTDTVCEGDSILLSVTNPAANTIYYWNGPWGFSSTGTSATIFPADTNFSGIYTVYSSISGCTSSADSINVLVIPSPMPVVNSNSPVCEGTSLQLQSFVNGTVTYSWTGPNGFASSVQNPVITNATSLNSGTYTLVVSGNGCTSPPVTDTVLVIPVIIPIAAGTDTLCEGDSILLSVTNPAANTIYYWNGPWGFSSSGTSATIFPADTNFSGMFTVYSNISGCTSSADSINVLVIPSPVPVVNSNSPVCEGASLQLQCFTNGTATYNWTGPSGFSSALQYPVISPAGTTNSGTYFVSAVMNGCQSPPTSLNVVVNPLPYLYLGSDTAICKNQAWLLSPSGSYSSYFWYDSTTGNNHSIDSTGVYFLTVTNSYGCKTSDTIKVIEIDCDPAVTNIFTPNGDGTNDIFTFADHYFKKVLCEIVDRWGRKIYSWDNPDGGWDGTDINNHPMPDGTYYYVVIIIDSDNKGTLLKGFVTLVR